MTADDFAGLAVPAIAASRMRIADVFAPKASYDRACGEVSSARCDDFNSERCRNE
jgi:hypothetical protein